MPEWIKHIVTGKDNETHDVIRWVALLGALEGLALFAFDVVTHSRQVSLQDFGIGLGALCAGVGAALKLKSDTEPDPK